jgi:hypothetical protein
VEGIACRSRAWSALAASFPILEAAQDTTLRSGQVIDNLVLLAPALLQRSEVPSATKTVGKRILVSPRWLCNGSAPNRI